MIVDRTKSRSTQRRLTSILLVGVLAAVIWPGSADAATTASFHRQPHFVFASSGPACDEADYAVTRYVDVNHPNVSDSNAGTEGQPWRTLVHAGATAGPGVRVLVKAGLYDHGDIEIEQSGTCFAAYPGQERQAIVRGAGIVSHGNSDLVVDGFKFEDSPYHAIRIVGPGAENIVITNNHTYDTRGSAVSIRGVTGSADPGNYDNIRNVLVAGNLVELANHGGGGEIISVGSGAVNVDVAYNEVRIGDPDPGDGDEGISFKEGVRDSRIFGNVIHNLSDKAISIDGGSSIHDPLVTNIEIFDNVVYDLPSNGMWVTTEGQGDVDGVHIHDNVVYAVEGNGILVYEHPGGAADGGTVRNVVIEHNTVWTSGRHSGYGGIRVDHPSAPGVVIRNNIAWGNNGYDIRGDNGTTIDSHNLCREGSLCQVTSNPLFVNPPTDFGLQSGSPAIGAASDGSNLGVRESTVVPPPPGPGDYFTDDDGSIFENDINAIAAAGITLGCATNLYCPKGLVTRDQMAAYLARAFDLEPSGIDHFTDDDESIFEDDINAIADARITLGCAPGLYCPDDHVTRGQMAAYLARAFDLEPSGIDYFTDDDGSIFEDDINAIADARITLGCAPGLYCPGNHVTRGQMAAYLARGLGL